MRCRFTRGGESRKNLILPARDSETKEDLQIVEKRGYTGESFLKLLQNNYSRSNSEEIYTMANPEMTILGGAEAAASGKSSQPETTRSRRGLNFRRYYSKPGVHPFDEIEWEFRTAVITNEKGETIF